MVDPADFYARLHAEFNFTLDPCATPLNAKCMRFFTRGQDGLHQDWDSERVFCNPPYGSQIGAWARKAYDASGRGALVVFLVHARTDTAWFHDWVYGKAELRFVRGRLKFGDGKNSAPFPSVIAIFRPPTTSWASRIRALVIPQPKEVPIDHSRNTETRSRVGQ